MELIESNLTLTDCMIVAVYNALVIAGKKIKYEEIRDVAAEKGWYDESSGFNTKHLNLLFKHFGLRCTRVRVGTTTKQMAEKVKKGASFLVMCEPSYGGTGHAMVATKGTKGVKIINSIYDPYGWRTICKDIKNRNLSVSAVEIKGAA